MQARLLQLEEELNTALTKNNSLEKTKARLTGELEDVQIDLDRVRKSFLVSVTRILNFIYFSGKCFSNVLDNSYPPNKVCTSYFGNLTGYVCVFS